MRVELIVTIDTHDEPTTKEGREQLAGVAREQLRSRLEQQPLPAGGVVDVGWISVKAKQGGTLNPDFN
ncbi:MAG TPA: hypothetical protein VD838_05870 [Anaeromyxobacteraceae bacterium]|nr:hypothetical protein [Anaeromyxobacteraceae bacterium]